MSGVGSFHLLAALALLASGCASAPPAEQEFSIVALTPGEGDSPRRVGNVACALANDKGHWQLTTPGTVRLTPSQQPLQMECAKDGFQPVSMALDCSQEPTTGEAIGMAAAFLLHPTVALAVFGTRVNCTYKAPLVWMMP